MFTFFPSTLWRPSWIFKMAANFVWVKYKNLHKTKTIARRKLILMFLSMFLHPKNPIKIQVTFFTIISYQNPRWFLEASYCLSSRLTQSNKDAEPLIPENKPRGSRHSHGMLGGVYSREESAGFMHDILFARHGRSYSRHCQLR